MIPHDPASSTLCAGATHSKAGAAEATLPIKQALALRFSLLGAAIVLAVGVENGALGKAQPSRGEPSSPKVSREYGALEYAAWQV